MVSVADALQKTKSQNSAEVLKNFALWSSKG